MIGNRSKVVCKSKVECLFPKSDFSESIIIGPVSSNSVISTYTHTFALFHFLLLAAWSLLRLLFINGIFGELGSSDAPPPMLWRLPLFSPVREAAEPVLRRLMELPPLLLGGVPRDTRLAELSKAGERGEEEGEEDDVERDVCDRDWVGGVQLATARAALVR